MASTQLVNAIKREKVAVVDDISKFLETKRLRLRPIQLSDIPVVQKYSLDPDWHRFLDFHTLESVEDFVQKAVNSPWSEHARFSILFEETMVGSVGLYIELKEKRAEIGYSLSKELSLIHI